MIDAVKPPYTASGMALVFLILCLVCPRAVFAEPEIAVQETYYQVSGTTAAQIRQSPYPPLIFCFATNAPARGGQGRQFEHTIVDNGGGLAV